MIKRSEIIEAGLFNKAHGIKGEISATLDLDIDFNDIKCLIIEIDGIYVPFFISNVRPKNQNTFLLVIEGIRSEQEAKMLTNKPFYILKDDLPENEDVDDEQGLYASDFIGYKLFDVSEGLIGEIIDINDVTDNVLFVVRTENGKTFLIPVADELITEFDTDKEEIFMDIPSGLLELN